MTDIGDGAKLKAADKTLYVALLSNSAMTILKMEGGLPSGVIMLCDKALAVEPFNIKVMYRRGQARMEMGDWDLVIEDMDRIIGLDPTNADAQKIRREAVVKKAA